jgi:PKHD-type hydroxylase
MIIQIADLLSPETAAALRQKLTAEAQSFTSGKATAGAIAKPVKHNDQSSGPAAQDAVQAVREALLAHPVFRAAARPKELVGLLVSRYRSGMSYGTHVDDAIMQGIRTDLSFTVFLCDPASYEGGELVIAGNDGNSAIKLAAGSVVVYPTTSLHHVAEVRSGERFVVVGWVRSFIRDAAQRELLFDLDQVASNLASTGADRALLNLVLKSRSNLVRMWAED